MKSDLIDMKLMLHHETSPGSSTEGAILVSEDGNNKNAVWLPKKAIEFTETGKGLVEVTLREQLALDKGLI